MPASHAFEILVRDFYAYNNIAIGDDTVAEIDIEHGTKRARIVYQPNNDLGLAITIAFIEPEDRRILTSLEGMMLALQLAAEAIAPHDFRLVMNQEGEPLILAHFDVSSMTPADLMIAIKEGFRTSNFILSAIQTFLSDKAGTDFQHRSLTDIVVIR